MARKYKFPFLINRNLFRCNLSLCVETIMYDIFNVLANNFFIFQLFRYY